MKKDDFYEKALNGIKPLKIMEVAIEDMQKKDKNNPELLPTYYEFICKMMGVLEELKEDMKEFMNQS